MTGTPAPAVAAHLAEEHVSVYVPTTPNPTSGYFMMVPRARVRELDMTVDEALKYVISMGVVARAPRCRRARRSPQRPFPHWPTRRLPHEIDRVAMRTRRRRSPGSTRCPARVPPRTNFHRIPRRTQRRLAVKRTDYCGRIDRRFLDQTVTLLGWVHRRRDHGGVIFIDLRDREGLVQVVCDPDRAEMFAIAETLRNEFVHRVTGRVRARPEGTVNPNLAVGEIEVLAPRASRSSNAVAHAAVPARRREPVGDRAPRRTACIDLRRPQMQKNLMLRYRTAMAVAPVPGRAGLHRHRDADAYQVHARGRARLPGAVARASRPVLSRCRSRRSCSSRC